MQQVVEYIEQNMGNADFEIERLAEHLNMCRTVFYRKLKSITGTDSRGFRWAKCASSRPFGSWSATNLPFPSAYMTGFKSPKYFSTLFKKAVAARPANTGRRNKRAERLSISTSPPFSSRFRFVF